MKIPYARFVVGMVAGILVSAAHAQVRHEIAFPDLPGYRTLKCDLHLHTVFSDGLVWPTVRVDEAWRLGLDAIALTDHIEYHPFSDDIRPRLNRSYEVAVQKAREHGLLFVRGAEITRDTPPGHFNATFLKDVAPLETEEFVEAIRRANEQGAFVVWNHHEWQGPERGGWMDIHTQLFENRWLHGMEVANGEYYYPQAQRWCLDRGLAMLGNTDMHDPDLSEQMTSEHHRTLTLVFAKERTTEALRDALFAGRTAVWYEDRLIGRREYLEPLFEASVQVLPPHALSSKTLWCRVRNLCAMDVVLKGAKSVEPKEVILPAGTTSLLKVPVSRPDAPVTLPYTVANFWIEPETGLPVTLTIPVARIVEDLMRNRPEIRCATATGAIMVDGTPDEPAWLDAVSLEDFRLSAIDDKPNAGTKARVTYDKSALYLAVTCGEPMMADARGDARQESDPWWEDDVVELFIDANSDEVTYQHFAVTVAGTQYDGRQKDGIWEGEWESAVTSSPDGWMVEIAVPWDTLGVPTPTPETRMGLQVVRSRPQDASVMQWSPTAGLSNHTPGMFGKVVFEQSR